MKMKMLFILNPENKWHRIIRRAIVVGVLSLGAVLINGFAEQAPAIWIPALTALGVAVDKLISETKK